MKINKTLMKTQRRNLDEKLKAFAGTRTVLNPKSGWIKAIREALGMTSQQLAERMGIRQSGVIAVERREVEKTVTLETLQKAARALNCELVYALVPQESLEKIVDEQARISAVQILRSTQHTMKLEEQEVSSLLTSLHLEELAMELKSKLDNRLWRSRS